MEREIKEHGDDEQSRVSEKMGREGVRGVHGGISLDQEEERTWRLRRSRVRGAQKIFSEYKHSADIYRVCAECRWLGGTKKANGQPTFPRPNRR